MRALGRAALLPTYVASGMASETYVQSLLASYWTTQSFQNSILSNDWLLLVYESQGQLVGLAEAMHFSEDGAILWKLYVLPGFQGRDVGSALVEGIISRLRKGVKTLYTEYLSQNAPAGEFYAARGFVFDREEGEAGENRHTYVKKVIF